MTMNSWQREMKREAGLKNCTKKFICKLHFFMYFDLYEGFQGQNFWPESP